MNLRPPFARWACTSHTRSTSTHHRLLRRRRPEVRRRRRRSRSERTRGRSRADEARSAPRNHDDRKARKSMPQSSLRRRKRSRCLRRSGGVGPSTARNYTEGTNDGRTNPPRESSTRRRAGGGRAAAGGTGREPPRRGQPPRGRRSRCSNRCPRRTSPRGWGRTTGGRATDEDEARGRSSPRTNSCRNHRGRWGRTTATPREGAPSRQP